MHLILSLPGLPAQVARRPAQAPYLARLLAVAGAPAREPDGLDAALAARFGIEHANGEDWPLAPLRLAALGIEPGTAYWLRADPVTLVAGRDDVRLTGAVPDLAAADAVALAAMLNAHFESDGIEFVAAQPDAWFVRAATRVAMRTRPVAVVAGRMLRDLLPTGPDAGTWQRWQSEIQMLLHDHPVNAARERDGKAPANSLWLSEGGTLPPRADAAPRIRTFAGGGGAVALALHAGQAARALPDGLHSVMTGSGDASTAIVAFDAPLETGAVERDWAAPAWTALAAGKLRAVTLITDDADGALAWTSRRPGPLGRGMLRLARHDLGTLLAAGRVVG